MRRLLALGVHAAVIAGGLVHRHDQNTSSGTSALEDRRRSARAFKLDQSDAHFGPNPATLEGAPAPHAWADWAYTTALLALDRPLYRSHEEDASDSDERADSRRHEIAARAEQQGDLELALAVRERYRPRRKCSLDSAPEDAAHAYAQLCHRLGRRACFLNLHLRLMRDDFPTGYTDLEPARYAVKAVRLREMGIDVERFFRGLLYQFYLPGQTRTEVDVWQLAGALKTAGLAASMTAWLRQEASRSDLDDFNRRRQRRH